MSYTLTLKIDNKSAVDLANNWSVVSCTRHVDIQNFFLCKLKDESLLVIKHILGEENDAGIFMKNIVASIFERHIPKFIGNDQYMKAET